MLKISVIIPFLNEEEHIATTLKAISIRSGLQIIAVDGGSTDRTTGLLESSPHSVEILTSRRGRARQMNRGAREADGDILLFLHADTQLQDGWQSELLHALEDERCCVGAFSFGTVEKSLFAKILTLGVNWRSRFCSLPYGDQAFWCRREFFEQIGGYKELAVMEDVDFIQRARALSTGRSQQITILSTAALTSMRRWEKEGHIRTTIKNLTALLLFALKVPNEKICRLYRSEFYPWPRLSEDS